MSSLLPAPDADRDDLEQLRGRAAALDATLHQRAAEIGRVRTELAAFKISYRRRVGLLHEELDELEAAIAQAELGEISKRLDAEGASPDAAPASARSEAPARYTSDAVRRLFRDVAKAIHPDLASDHLARDRRHALMIEANRAYTLGDEERLRWILQSWEMSPEAVQGSDPDATRLRLVRRIAQLEEQLVVFAGDLDALQDSPMWKLKAMVDEAAAKGKDLVRNMVIRLRRDILVARNRLAAMQTTPSPGAR